MTTSVTVKAVHGWPVDVIPMKPGTQIALPALRVEPNATREFHVHSGQDLRIVEVQPVNEDNSAQKEPSDRMLQFFAYAHRAPHLQTISKPFDDLAHHIVDTLPPNPERTAGLRKLLAAKDCAVRAHLFK